jgi:hypothetical protein
LQPQAELNVARRTDGTRNHSGTRASDRLAGQIELRMIQDVEEFATQL